MSTTRWACLAALALALATPATAQTVLDRSAASSVHLETAPGDGGRTRTVAHIRNLRYETYQVFVGEDPLPQPRLATITTEFKLSSDQEPVDPAAKISVDVDDISGGQAKRLASFSDPGQRGVIVADSFFASTLPGCCDAPDLHRVRLLESGRTLFTSTGPGAVGSAGWVEAPNSRPRLWRWAAFDGSTRQGDDKRGLLGTITYGGPEGPLQQVQVLSKDAAQYDDLWEGLAHGASFLWVDPKASGDNGKPGAGDPGSPYTVWSLDKVSDPQKFGGFQLVLVLDAKRLAFIPVERDRLALQGAVLSPRIGLRALAR